MPLNFTPRPKESTAPVTRPNDRPQVSIGKPQTSTARADALKARLTGKPAPTQPQAPRRAGSSARAEEFAALKKFQAPTAPQPKPIGQSTARQTSEDLSQIEPPPSGLAEGSELSPVHNSVEPQKAAEATNEPLSPQFVALAKKERTIRKAQLELKAKEDAFKQEQAKFISKDALLSDPLKTLTEAGVQYDRLVELQLNQISPDPNQKLLDRISELESKLGQVDEKFTSRDTAAYNAAVNQIRTDIKLLVDSDPTFEITKATGQTEEVVKLIEKIFDEENIVLPVEEACNIVENKLVEREYRRVEQLSKLSKIKSRMAPPAEIPAEATPLQPQFPKTTTLTNQGAVTRPLSARDRAVLAVKKSQGLS